MITFIIGLAIQLQSTGEVAVAIQPDNPETWVVEYPTVISPFVDDYYNCLKSGGHVLETLVQFSIGHVVDGNTFFEEQHRRDIPRCSKLKADGIEQSQAVLERLGRTDEFGAEQITKTFDTIDVIHVARARDLDGHLRMGAQTERFYDELEAKAAEDAKL